LKITNLSTFAVVFELESKEAIGKATQHFGDTLGWFGQHGFDRDTCQGKPIIMTQRQEFKKNDDD
jgi:hypothetical protein